MKKSKVFLLPLFLVVVLSGCAPYVAVGGKYTAGTENFEVDLPSGWRQHFSAFDPMFRQVLPDLVERRDLAQDVVRITRDGLNLQQIGIGRIALDSDLPHTKRKVSKNMLPQEIAEVILDNIRSNPGMTNLQIVENTAASVGGNQGFKLLYSYKTKGGLIVKAAYYGLTVGSWHYYILYEAPQRHYFDRDYATFEQIKNSFRILRKESAS